MARLILSLDGTVLAEYNMNKERYTIGRLPDNDIRIDNPAVSGHHSLIINILNDSFLEDLNSTNGTYVNGKLIKKHALQHGDVITAGHHQLRFVEDDEAAAGRVREDHGDPALGTPGREAARRRHAMTRPPPAGAPRARRTARRPLKKAKLQVLSGAFAGRELELTKALTTLGRPGVQVAAITRRSEGFFIVHVDAEGDEQLPAGQRRADRRPGAQARGQRCDPARRREDGVLRGLRAIQPRPGSDTRRAARAAPPCDPAAPAADRDATLRRSAPDSSVRTPPADVLQRFAMNTSSASPSSISGVSIGGARLHQRAHRQVRSRAAARALARAAPRASTLPDQLILRIHDVGTADSPRAGRPPRAPRDRRRSRCTARAGGRISAVI